MTLRTLLTLGRTSNLPTVWSNVLCGAVLSGAPFGLPALGLLVLFGSASYEGGMFLNDAFDAQIDAKERPERPIPSGRITRGAVFGLGFSLLFAGLAALAALPLLGFVASGYRGLYGGVGTTLAILAYDRWHKGRAWSPLVMGACRAGLYVTAALAVSGRVSTAVWLGAGALWLYVVGLTHVARFENGSAIERAWVAGFVLSPLVVSAPLVVSQRSALGALCFLLLLGWSLRSLGFALRGGPGQIPRAVVTLIAGASLVDAVFIAVHGSPSAVLAALGCFLVTLRWQRRIPGT